MTTTIRQAEQIVRDRLGANAKVTKLSGYWLVYRADGTLIQSRSLDKAIQLHEQGAPRNVL